MRSRASSCSSSLGALDHQWYAPLEYQVTCQCLPYLGLAYALPWKYRCSKILDVIDAVDSVSLHLDQQKPNYPRTDVPVSRYVTPTFVSQIQRRILLASVLIYPYKGLTYCFNLGRHYDYQIRERRAFACGVSAPLCTRAGLPKQRNDKSFCSAA